jgi:hypothetical protein
MASAELATVEAGKRAGAAAGVSQRVGGGVTRLTVALPLGRAGAEVTVLEAGELAAGTTGYTTAKVTSLHGLTYKRRTDSLRVGRRHLRRRQPGWVGRDRSSRHRPRHRLRSPTPPGLAEIGAPDGLAGPDLGRRTGHELLAEVEDVDPLADTEDQAHVVFDHEDADTALRHALDEEPAEGFALPGTALTSTESRATSPPKRTTTPVAVRPSKASARQGRPTGADRSDPARRTTDPHRRDGR